MKETLPKVDIVICIHNALKDVTKCIDSVMRSEYPVSKIKIILIDDGSDQETKEYLETISSAVPNMQLIRRDNAGGYTVAANTGLAASKAEYCALLNSDTIVPKKWLKKIVKLFSDYHDVGIIGPLSNAASWQSVPDISNPKGGWAVNELPNGWSVDDMDKCVESCQMELNLYPRVPLLNGFCYVVSAKVYKTIGPLDEINFPRGFGEEDDYSMRAANAGFGLMVAIDTYVFHAKSKSYGSAKRDNLSKLGAAKLTQKHSEVRIKRSVESMKKNPYFLIMREAITQKVIELTEVS